MTVLNGKCVAVFVWPGKENSDWSESDYNSLLQQMDIDPQSTQVWIPGAYCKGGTPALFASNISNVELAAIRDAYDAADSPDDITNLASINGILVEVCCESPSHVLVAILPRRSWYIGAIPDFSPLAEMRKMLIKHGFTQEDRKWDKMGYEPAYFVEEDDRLVVMNDDNPCASICSIRELDAFLDWSDNL